MAKIMKNNISNQPIAILGGMGPQASARLLEIMINISSKDFRAKNDSEFPEIILNSIPVPNFVSNEKNLNNALGILKIRIKNLETLNPSCFAIACNTAHLFLPKLQSRTRIPFVSIIDEVSKKVEEIDLKCVGIMGSPNTINSGLYQKRLKNVNVKVINPTEFEIKVIENVIFNILAGKIKSTDKRKLTSVANSLKRKGAQGIILGCTELPLIFPKEFPIPVFDSIEILARTLVKNAYETNNKNGIINL